MRWRRSRRRLRWILTKRERGRRKRRKKWGDEGGVGDGGGGGKEECNGFVLRLDRYIFGSFNTKIRPDSPLIKWKERLKTYICI